MIFLRLVGGDESYFVNVVGTWPGVMGGIIMPPSHQATLPLRPQNNNTEAMPSDRLFSSTKTRLNNCFFK